MVKFLLVIYLTPPFAQTEDQTKVTMSRFAEVARFHDLYLAEVAKAKLQSEDIYCYLHSKHHISMKWYLAFALGGVRLLVRNDDEMKARRILQRDESHLLATMDFPPLAAEDVCRRCGSENLKKIDLKIISGWLIIITSLPLIFWGTYYRCKDCGCKN